MIIVLLHLALLFCVNDIQVRYDLCKYEPKVNGFCCGYKHDYKHISGLERCRGKYVIAKHDGKSASGAEKSKKTSICKDCILNAKLLFDFQRFLKLERSELTNFVLPCIRSIGSFFVHKSNPDKVAVATSLLGDFLFAKSQEGIVAIKLEKQGDHFNLRANAAVQPIDEFFVDYKTLGNQGLELLSISLSNITYISGDKVPVTLKETVTPIKPKSESKVIMIVLGSIIVSMLVFTLICFFKTS